ncbi:MAG: 50S ribosomal protein L44e [Candidatus Woesearchaeota archaeon]
MKIPKTVKRHCPYCNKHTEHRIIESKKRTPGSAHPLSRGSRTRQKLRHRGIDIGMGNKGRFSRPPVKNWKSTGKKLTKKTDLRYECKECKKQHMQKKGKRTKKLQIV